MCQQQSAGTNVVNWPIRIIGKMAFNQWLRSVVKIEGGGNSFFDPPFFLRFPSLPFLSHRSRAP